MNVCQRGALNELNTAVNEELSAAELTLAAGQDGTALRTTA